VEVAMSKNDTLEPLLAASDKFPMSISWLKNQNALVLGLMMFIFGSGSTYLLWPVFAKEPKYDLVIMVKSPELGASPIKAIYASFYDSNEGLEACQAAMKRENEKREQALIRIAWFSCIPH
jgi:hypothetical protein